MELRLLQNEFPDIKEGELRLQLQRLGFNGAQVFFRQTKNEMIFVDSSDDSNYSPDDDVKNPLNHLAFDFDNDDDDNDDDDDDEEEAEYSSDDINGQFPMLLRDFIRNHNNNNNNNGIFHFYHNNNDNNNNNNNNINLINHNLFLNNDPNNINDVIEGWRQMRQQNHIFIRPPQPLQPPPAPRVFETKKIELYGIVFIISDVQLEDDEQLDERLLQTIRRASDISKANFSLAKASTYLTMVLNHGEIPKDFLDRLVIAACDPNTSNAPLFREQNESILKHVFNDLRISDIKSVFHSNGMWLDKTIKLLQSNPTAPMRKGRIRQKQIEVSDALISLQLNELYLVMEKERQKHEKEAAKDREFKEAEKNGFLMECECCFLESPIDWMVQCPDGHLFCKKCIETQIETVISEGRSNVPCLKFGGCDQIISVNELEAKIDKRTIERLFQTEALNAIASVDLPNKVTCFKCGFIVFYEGDGPMVCPECKSRTCPKCGESWHPEMSCEQMKDIDKGRLVEEKMNEAVVRTCPKCRTQFMKDEGCNKMECPRCHTWICYWCRNVIPKEIGYEHFWRQQGPCPPDKCPLWVQNDALHLVEAERAKDEAVTDLEGDKKTEATDNVDL